MNVYQKLNEARERFHSLPLKKTGHNKFAGYNYFELGDFLIPALRVFKEVGLCATVYFDKEHAYMVIRNADKPDEAISISSPMGSAALKGCHEVQNIGAVETYQRRYLWVAALEIVEHDALDASSGAEEAKPKKSGVVADVQSTTPALPPETQSHLAKLAETIKEDFDAYGVQAAFERIEAEGLDYLEKIHLSTLIPSAMRNKIKAYSVEFHSRKKEAA